jgi:hypothetical protein
MIIIFSRFGEGGDTWAEQLLTRHAIKEQNDSMVVQEQGNSDEKLLHTDKNELVLKYSSILITNY